MPEVGWAETATLPTPMSGGGEGGEEGAVWVAQGLGAHSSRGRSGTAHPLGIEFMATFLRGPPPPTSMGLSFLQSSCVPSPCHSLWSC